MTFLNITQAILITLAASYGNASETRPSIQKFPPCQEVTIKSKELKLTDCKQSNNLTYATYEVPESKSHSNNEFNREKIVIATSSDKKRLLEQSGFRFISGQPSFKKTKLDVIIFPDHLTKRRVIRSISEQGWSVNQEDVQYFSPHDTGYSMSCFTAFKGKENINVTVAQCLGYGGLESFKKILSDLDFN